MYIITLFACKKSNSASQPKSLVGTWIWFQTYCDCPGPQTTPDSVGYQDILTFNSDHTWKRVQNSIQIDSGTYQTGHGTFTNYSPGGTTWNYDSVSFYKNKTNVGWDAYQINRGDTYLHHTLPVDFLHTYFPQMDQCG
ncbi:MAG: hypothetical protein C5B59_07400 [Bacteroidetes bacterium]|nr:MAG: hypothetical protein C5B59_07400 [Bacteroidota bacterium]